MVSLQFHYLKGIQYYSADLTQHEKVPQTVGDLGAHLFPDISHVPDTSHESLILTYNSEFYLQRSIFTILKLSSLNIAECYDTLHMFLQRCMEHDLVRTVPGWFELGLENWRPG